MAMCCVQEEDTAILLPGYQPKPSVYHGPKFPPEVPPLARDLTSTDVLDDRQRRRDLLESHARNWCVLLRSSVGLN